MFRDTARYPFTRDLEENWQTLRGELKSLEQNHFHAWPEKSLYGGDGGWQTFGLYAFGQKKKENCRLCPETTRLVESIPGMVMAGFSRMAPGTHIQPHTGYDGWAQFVLRCHLALETNDACALRVANETRTWEAGKTLIFCDATEHEAWNRGDTTRTVLLLDFKNPEFRKTLLNPALTPELQQFTKDHWATLSRGERVSFRIWQLMNLFRRSNVAAEPAGDPRVEDN